MEDSNQNAIVVAHSLNSTQNEPNPNEEQMAVLSWPTTTSDNNPASEGVGVEALPDPIVEEASVAAGSGQVVKRGRGRPRKYDINERRLSRAITPPPGFAIQPFEGGDCVKRGRGRPRGSGRLQILASIGGIVAETAGGGFTPRMVRVDIGEDIISKITSCYQRGPLSVCVLSAAGSVSSVTIREPGSTYPTEYEGCFEIVSLTGSYAFSPGVEGAPTKSMMLIATLAKQNGDIFGGNIENSLKAASPIDLILATFKQNKNQTKKRRSSGSSNGLNISGNNQDAQLEDL